MDLADPSGWTPVTKPTNRGSRRSDDSPPQCSHNATASTAATPEHVPGRPASEEMDPRLLNDVLEMCGHLERSESNSSTGENDIKAPGLEVSVEVLHTSAS